MILFPMKKTQPTSVVTGAAGFLGSHLTDLLIARGHKVIGIDNFVTGSVNNIVHLVGVSMIACGWNHNVALLTNGTVKAWGYNGSVFGWNLTNVPPNLTNATVISAQALHSLALTSNGTVVAWGFGANGETNIPAGLSNVVAIAAGGQFNLAVQSNGTVTAWGYNGSGQCTVPAGLTNVADVAAGWNHSVALKKDGTMVCWGDNAYGECNVPTNLNKVVAITAGGDPVHHTAYTMAFKSDGSMAVWGNGPILAAPSGLNGVIPGGGGMNFGLAILAGPPAPVITLQPQNQFQLPGGSVTFTSLGQGVATVHYQWQFNGTNIFNATNSALTLTNVGTAQQGNYLVIVTNITGSVTSSPASFALVTPPVIISQTLPTNQLAIYQNYFTLGVSVAFQGAGFPFSYQWQFNGTNMDGQNSSQLTLLAGDNSVSGTYSVIITNVVGSTNATWQVQVAQLPGSTWGWGDNTYGESAAPLTVTDVLAIAAGEFHSVLVKDDGTVIAWGGNANGQTNVPSNLTNAIAAAAGYSHTLVLKADGSIVAWGQNDLGQTNVPANATNIIAVAAGGKQSLALKKDGTVLQWGLTNAPIPAGLTSVTAIAAGTNFCLALLSNSTVVAWGANGSGQTNVPVNLSNVVAIAAGGTHALALKQDGTVVAWGSMTNVPYGLSNVMGIAAGDAHSVALLNNGTVQTWGNSVATIDLSYTTLNNVKSIAAGGDHSIAAMFSPLIQYPVEVTKDLLLIYNTNSTDSIFVKDYYLAHRPNVTGANVLGISCSNNEVIPPDYCTDVMLPQIAAWLTNNPTKHPQYVVLFYDLPSRVNINPAQGDPSLAYWPSVQYQIRYGCFPGWNPFVTSINMGSTNDCIAYINKLEYFGTNYSPGQLIISAGAYGNTNYIIDDVTDLYCGSSYLPMTTNGLLSAGVTPVAIDYLAGCETLASMPHLTNAMNVAGYITWGQHSSLGGDYPVNGEVHWSGNSSWWIMRSEESFNGQREAIGQGNFTKWFTSTSFGGTNYSNTPIGGPTYTDEPGAGATDNSIFFGSWAGGKNLAYCAWNSRYTIYFQTVGDPFVTR